MRNFSGKLPTLLVIALLSPIASGEQEISAFIGEPSGDRWMYPMNGTPGTRPQASTFSALPEGGGVDDRFGQYVIIFDTVAAGIPSGLGVTNYDVSSISLTATIGQDRLFIYDPTDDHWITYGEMALPDEDPGRPLELHGTGFRNGFTASTFQETSPYGGSATGQRNAFALGFDENSSPRDVSNNVTENFDSHPWAVGSIAGITPGDSVPVDTIVNFHIDLTAPGVTDYIRSGLNEGRIWLTLSSLHPAIQEGGEFVAYHTRDSPVHQLFGDVAPTLAISCSLPSGFTSFHRAVSKNVNLGFIGLPGNTYTVQASPDLRSETWENLQTYNPSHAGLITWQGVSPQEKRFFRLARIPASP